MDESGASGIAGLADPGTFRPYDEDVTSTDPLDFDGYAAGLVEAVQRAGTSESVVAGNAVIGGRRVELAEFNFAFLAGSMGEASGERLARALERAARRRVPFVLRTATGGARMQEGMRSLVQMPKVVVARRALAAAGQPLIAVLGHPTTGGVLSSVAALADVAIAEADATVGFAGPRVAQAQTGVLPGKGSHTAEAAYGFGLVDVVTPAAETAQEVRRVLAILDADVPEDTLVPELISEPDDSAPAGRLAVDMARADDRPVGPQILTEIASDRFELHGDRAGGDDPACVVALARIAGRAAMVLALDRRHRPGPGAYRKAVRALDIAGRIRVPVLTLVDTRGADAAEDSEAGGIAWAIAAMFDRILSVTVPVVAVVTGEGGSGGALAFASGDVVLAYEHSIFSVIAPELAAEILWRDATRAREAADMLRLTAHDLLRWGVADALLPEPVDGASIAGAFAYHLERLDDFGSEDLVAQRHRRWRTYG